MKTFRALVIAGLVGLGTASPTAAAEILFARVGSSSYVADGASLVGFLTAAGHNVTYVDLSAAIISDFTPYSQVWVYDLVTGPDDNANQLANYTNIANWYNGLADQNLIVDGRIISSGPDWTPGGEPAWIQNYATQLASVGGGMVLGTDHDVFQSGINSINALIGINPFSGFFPGPQATVDPNSPLHVPSLNPCAAAPSQQCINDNSTTGFVPTGLQLNGQFLTPVAYHGTTSTAFNNAAVSSTFQSPTFPVPEPGILLLVGAGFAAVARRRLHHRQS